MNAHAPAARGAPPARARHRRWLWLAGIVVVVGGAIFVDRSPQAHAALSAVLDPGSGAPLGGQAAGWTLLALGLATFASEDLACVAAGVLAAGGRLSFVAVTLACFVGIFVGDLGLVALGRAARAGAAGWMARWHDRHADKFSEAERWIGRNGAKVVFLARFVPGLRLPTYVACGWLRLPLGPFLGWFVLAGLIWTPALVGAAAWAGKSVQVWWRAHGWETGLGVLVAWWVLWALGRKALSLTTWRGRRLALGRWRRLTRWEFWPMWAVYPPVIASVMWQMLRHRSITVVTAANCGIGGGGGLVGESKSEILTGLAGGGDRIARWTLLAPGDVADRVEALEAWRTAAGLEWPIVLKPDVGERGTGVVIARDAARAVEALAAEPGALIAQAYVPGVEYGVFYMRHPDAERGRIFAVTDKRMVSVTGDGTSTLETLILRDDRAVCMAELHLAKHTDAATRVPAAGEKVTLTELGTHCRGSLFLDGTHLVTPELEVAVDEVSKAFRGFNFGRYDVRTPSAEALQRGEFTAIELNGLTSEATSIYDPRHSLWYGWATLIRQWRMAFEIGAANKRRGARTLTVRQAWRLWIHGEIPGPTLEPPR